MCYILFRNLIVALSRLVLQNCEPVFLEENLITNYRSSLPEVFLGKRVLKIWSKFTGEHPCRSANLLKSHFGMGVILKICCIFSEHLFIRHLWRAASESKKNPNGQMKTEMFFKLYSYNSNCFYVVQLYW